MQENQLQTPFARLQEYERRSLAHQAGSPLSSSLGWRGLGWRLGERRLISPYRQVVEVLSVPSVTSIPGAQPWLLGLANVRGNLLPVVDLRQFIEGQRSAPQERQRVLQVNQEGGDVCVLIDELLGQHVFDESEATDTAGQALGRYASYVTHGYHQAGVDWTVFDLEQLVASPEFRQAAA